MKTILGDGSQGHVYLATCVKTMKYVAIKTICVDKLNDNITLFETLVSEIQAH
jgi:hypothetical protein